MTATTKTARSAPTGKAAGRGASKQDTREALVAAGLAEFAERGLDAPSLDAICARAGYTRGAFYVHFRDRDDFLESVMEKVFGSLLDATIATGDAGRDLAETVERFVGLAATLAGRRTGYGARTAALPLEIHRVLDACARSPRLRQRFIELISAGSSRVSDAVARGQRAGSVRADVDAGALGQILTVLAFGAMTALDTGVPLDLDAAGEVVLRLLRPAPASGR